MLNLTTKYGSMDLTLTPSGPLQSFEDWDRGAVVIDLGDEVFVKVAALDDIINSKRVANRPKDQRSLPYLESLRDQLR